MHDMQRIQMLEITVVNFHNTTAVFKHLAFLYVAQ